MLSSHASQAPGQSRPQANEKFCEIDDEIQISYYPDGPPGKGNSVEKVLPVESSTSQLLENKESKEGSSLQGRKSRKINFSYS